MAQDFPERKRAELSGLGGVDKTAVLGVKERGTKRVSAAVVEATEQQTLPAYVTARSGPARDTAAANLPLSSLPPSR